MINHRGAIDNLNYEVSDATAVNDMNRNIQIRDEVNASCFNHKDYSFCRIFLNFKNKMANT